jgi:hypothetical protein
VALFAGPDVEARPQWLRNHWLLAVLVAGFHIDLAMAIQIGTPRLANALRLTDLPVPAPTLWLLATGEFIKAWWFLVLPPLVIGPVLLAWRYGQSVVPVLQVWLLALIALLIAVCAAILLPVKTIVTAPTP